MSTKNRIFYYDALRALAIFGIICCHVAADFALKSGLNTSSYYLICFFDCFRDFSIPIFVMLSGALLLNRNLPTVTFVKKRFNRVFVPFIFWFIIFTIFAILFFDYVNLNYIISTFLGKRGTIGVIFWFIWMIIVVYILIFIINKIFLFKNNKNHFSNFVKVASVIFIIYSIIVTLGLFNLGSSKIISYVSFIGYAILGCYLANTDFTKGKIADILKLTPLKIGILSLILSIGIYLYYILFNVVPMSVSMHKFSSFSYFNILLLILSICLFLSFKYLLDSILLKEIEKGTVGKLITSISKHSFGIYFIHYLILKSIYIITDYKILVKNPVKVVPLLIVVVFLSSWFIIGVIDKVPYLNKCLGAS